MINPLKNKVLIEITEGQEVTRSGIILVAKKEEKPHIAKVIAIGDTVTQVKENDTIIVSKYVGTKVKHEGKQYIILNETDILAKMEG